MGGIGWWPPLINGGGRCLSLFVGGGGACAWRRGHCCGSVTSSIHDALLVLSFSFYSINFAFSSFFIYSIQVLY